MERTYRDDPVADGTAMDSPEDQPVMPAAKELAEAPEAGGDESSAVEGISGIAATHRVFGGGTPGSAAGVGTHVQVDEDEHVREGDVRADEGVTDSSDPRGY
jgi:hypothetical protein